MHRIYFVYWRTMRSSKVQEKSKAEDCLLVKRAIDGSEEAFEHIMIKHKKSVYQRALRLVQNHDDAEDITLETFAKAFTHIKQYSDKFAFSTWLYTIASNTSIDHLRRQRSKPHTIEQDSDTDDAELNGFRVRSNNPNPEEDLILKQRAGIIKDLIQELPEKYQDLINLRYFKEFSYEEIAKALDLPLGTVKVQLFRARNILYEKIVHTDVKE